VVLEDTGFARLTHDSSCEHEGCDMVERENRDLSGFGLLLGYSLYQMEDVTLVLMKIVSPE